MGVVRPVSVLVAALVLASCASDPDPSGASRDSDTPDLPAVAEIARGDLPEAIDYVALGDSYSSGPMITTLRSDPLGCMRSTDNYAAFLAGWLEVESYTDVTCSAAQTADLTRGQLVEVTGERVGPQVEAVTEETDLVTVGIGGNDFGIFAALIQCLPGVETSSGCGEPELARLQKDADRVRPRIARVVEAVAERAPEAEVYVVGYPEVLPERAGCPALPLPPDLLAAARSLAESLNDAVRTGAEQAGAAYVDLTEVSRGHDVCAGKAAWINGPRARPGIGAPYHPVLEGMRAAAGEVYAAITGEAAPEAERAQPPVAAVVRNPVPAASPAPR